MKVESSQAATEENSIYRCSERGPGLFLGYVCQGGLHTRGHMEGAHPGGWKGSSRLRLRKRRGLESDVLGGRSVRISAEMGNRPRG